MPKDLRVSSILVLEDNPGDFFLIEDYLIEKFKNINIHHGKSFADGELYLKSDNDYSVILLDLLLSDLQKEELIEKIQKISGEIPIIVLTGYTDLKVASNLLSNGISDFLIKDELSSEILYKSIIYAIERENFIVGINTSKILYQNLFDFSPLPMWLFDIETLKFLDVNEASISKYGYSKEEFLNLTVKDIRPLDEMLHLEKSLMRRSENRSSLFAGVFKHQKKSGELMFAEIYSREIDYNGKIACLVSVNDITERKNNLNTIELQNAKLKNIAWSQSHVVRAPLSRILGIIHLLEVESLKSEDAPFLMEQLKNSGLELDNIIRDIVHQTQLLNL
jgi:PAS domain S-box-containing protein